MKRKRLRGERKPYAAWHAESGIKSYHELKCSACGAVMYQGPKPTFAAISCPGCRQVWDLR